MALVVASPEGHDQVCITYPRVVPHAQVQHDLQVLGAAAGWPITVLSLSDAVSPAGGPKTTSVVCQASGAVRTETHGFQVEPFAATYADYPRVVLSYMVGSAFAFSGLRTFDNGHVKITLDQRDTVYTYRITNRDASKTALHLPYLQAPAAAPAPRPRTPSPWLVALVAALALGTGGIVYLALARNG